MKSRVELTAHSGSDGTPDNSIEFVNYALTTGADCFEIDVRRDQRSGELLLGHDDIEEGAPSLREAFYLLKGHPSMKINCDLKEPGLEKLVLQLAAECQVTDRIVFSGTVDPLEIEDPKFRRQRIFWNIEEQIDGFYDKCRADFAYRLTAVQELCDKMDQLGVDYINCYYGLADEEFIKLAQMRGKNVGVWTVNDMELVEKYLKLGVKNVTTRKIAGTLLLSQGVQGYRQ